MGRLPLLAMALAAAVAAPLPQNDVVLVRQWIDAVRAHHPGAVDEPLETMAKLDPADFDLIRRRLQPILKDTFPQVELRNDTLRRAALFHMDIAILMPERAAVFTQDSVAPKIDPYTGRPEVRREADAVFLSSDGEYVAAARDSAHWWLASELLKKIQPEAGSDPFVARWHRSVIARFEARRLFGSAFYAVKRALETVPRDPWVLLYAGALHEANASAAVQSIPATRPNMARELNTPAAEKELRAAERFFRGSVEAGGPPEAQVRLARVLGRLGNHAQAVTLLHSVLPKLQDPERQYFANLFLGTEEAAIGHREQARAALERAARLFPEAQTPLVVLSGVEWQAGNRTDALRAIERVGTLPAVAGERKDPWWRYYFSFADDADEQIAAVRSMVDAKGRP